MIRTDDADGSASSDAPDFAGENTTPTASYIGLGGPSFVVASTASSVRGNKYRDFQLVGSFQVAGAVFGGIAANSFAGTRIAVAVVPRGESVTLSGRVAAEKGTPISFLYVDRGSTSSGKSK